MAWVEKLSSGKYRGAWRNPSGKKCYTRRPEFPEHPYTYKADARDAAQEAEVKANRTAAVEAGTLSPRLSWGAWWDLIVDGRNTGLTDTDLTDESIVRLYLRPKWGDTELNLITHRRVQNWIDALESGAADEWAHKHKPEASYVRRIYGTFSGSMRKAVDEDVLTANPCAGIKLPTIRKKRKLHTTTDEAQVIGAKLRADYKDAIDLLLETGLRPSELCGLHRHHVDVENMRIDVELVYVARKKVMRPWPKDKDARRVPLTREGLSIIRRRLDGRDLTEGCGVRHSDDSVCTSPLIFLTELGRPMNVQQLGNRMRYAAAAHKVPKRTPYSARRGFSTRAARGGMDAFAIAEVMGHADVKQTQEYVQDERIGPLMRAALGDRDPLMVVEGGHEGEVPDVHVRDRLTPHGEVPYGSAHGRHRTLDHRPGG